MSRITRLVSENVKRIKVVEITPDPSKSVVTIRGDNAQGKTSVLDTIAYVIGGKRIQPPNLIREGESYARGLIETEDLIVERRWKSNTESVVEVRSKEGAKFSSPQKMLDALVARLSFDPLHFMNLEPSAQLTALKQIVGLDFSKLDGQRLKFYDDRTAANRELASLQARLGTDPVPATPPERLDVAALLAEQEVMRAAINSREARGVAHLAAQVNRAHHDNHVRECEAAMAKAYARAKEAKIAEALALTAFENSPAPAPEALAEIATKIATASSHNERCRLQTDRAALAVQVANEADRVKKLGVEIERIDSEKATLTAAAAFPVQGLGFGPLGVTLNSLPLEQASGAEKLRVSVGIGLALNPELKVLLVRDGSLLDSKNLILLEELATAAGGQVWLEMVGKEGVGIIIEDGSVEERAPSTVAA